MNYIEALQALVDGKKVKENCWDGSDYMYLKNGDILTAYGNRMSLSISDERSITDDNYEIYQSEEDKLITDGKRWRILRVCEMCGCENCESENEELYKFCQYRVGTFDRILTNASNDEVDKLYNAVKGEIDA